MPRLEIRIVVQTLPARPRRDITFDQVAVVLIRLNIGIAGHAIRPSKRGNRAQFVTVGSVPCQRRV